ncbi:hypothetical protein PROFUN_11002 [Planoprotostelium fungivorum]|uniref:Uncharacterized protein n=1 Tax=Planoprotostelium fungivorum TaxID=1890364 RepID=A0A2P6NC14_9EUKA|nr:hypothetical protein PROFUN_11002 [Planoprotostelium fungivorum]
MHWTHKPIEHQPQRWNGVPLLYSRPDQQQSTPISSSSWRVITPTSIHEGACSTRQSPQGKMRIDFLMTQRVIMKKMQRCRLTIVCKCDTRLRVNEVLTKLAKVNASKFTASSDPATHHISCDAYQW